MPRSAAATGTARPEPCAPPENAACAGFAAGLRAVARACRALAEDGPGRGPLEQALAELAMGAGLAHAALYESAWEEATLSARIGPGCAPWLPRRWPSAGALPLAPAAVLAVELPGRGRCEGVLVLWGRGAAHPALRAALLEGAPALGAALARRREVEELRRRCSEDPLTRALTPRAFTERLEEEVDRARRYGVALGLALVDVDHMSALNARCGRDAGDAALAELARLVRAMKRRSDGLGRTRGDELAWLLPEADAGATLRCAERLRRAVAAHPFPRALRISVSAGVASLPRQASDPGELRAVAERSLTLAKKAGRNRVGPAAAAAIH